MSDHGEGVEPGGAALSLPYHFKAMFDHSPDAIFVESLDGKIMEVNSAACRLHGRARDELIGVSWIELVPPEHRDAAERDQENLVNSMGVIGGYSLGPDGQSIPVEIRATRIEFEGEPAMLVHVRDTVERDRAVEALHESEQRQSLLLRSLPMALYTARVGDDFAAQWVSDQIMRITGFSPQQFANEPDFWAAGVHADDQERVSAAFDEFIASNAESMSIEYRWQCADGQYRWFLDQPVLIRDQRGEPKEILGTWLDITDRKQSEIALHESEQRIRDLFERSPDAIFVEDLDGNVLDANPAACRLHGLTRQQLVGTNVLDLVPPEMREQVRRDFPKLAEGDCSEYEGTSWTHDGRAVPVELRVSRIEFDGRPALLLHVRDVTERNEAEQRLRDTEEQTKLITDSIPALIAYIDTDHHYRYVNAAYARYFGRVANDLIDCHVRDVVGDAVYEKIGPQLNLALAGDRISFDVEAPLPGEESHFLHADYVPHKNEQGAISGVYALIDDITERVQAKRRLRESEEHTRRMADMLPMTISYIDTDMRYLFNNAMHEQWFGPQVIGQQVCDVVGEENFRVVKPHLEKALRGEQVNVDVQGKDDDGNPRHVNIIYAPHFDESGNVQGVYGVATNITERHRVEDALQHQTVVLTSVLKGMADGVAVLNAEGRLILFNPAAHEILGVGPTDQGPDTWQRHYGMWLPDQKTEFPEERYPMVRALAGEAVDDEVMFIRNEHRPEGSWITVNARPVRDPDGNIRGSVAVFRDITKQKKAEDALRLTQFSVDNAADAVFWINRDGRLICANQTAANGLGYTREQLMSMSVFDVDMIYQQDVWPDLWEEIRQSKQKNFESVLRHSDGDTFPVEISVNFLEYDGGEFVFAHIRDISERKHAEEQHAELESTLRHAQKMDAVGTLASGIAHDFNNLLTAIVGYTDLARRTLPPDAAAIEALQMVDQAARQAEGVTRSLLTFTHKARTEKIPTDMGSAVTESIHLLRRVLPDSIALTLDIEENAKLWVHGDAVQLQQVIMNLAVNARDAMPEGGELNISLNHAGDTVVLMVRDTGMGMTNDVRARIFEPFFTTKPRGRGTGLGLAVIHGIIREHAGQIDVSSTVGEGTRFTISLPFCETPPQQEPQLKPREKTLAGDASGVIVLVDSHDYVRAMMASTLRKLGYDVIDAASVESAMNLFGACGQRADLAILDIDEPGSGSRACLDDLRRTNEGMPAVLLTSEPDIDDEVQSAPNTRTLQKPFKMPKLIEAVEIVSRKPEGD